MQYASECRTDAGVPSVGTPTTSHSKSVIVRSVGTTRRDSMSIPRRPFTETAHEVLGLSLLVRGGDAGRPEVEESVQRGDRAPVQGEPGRRRLVVDQPPSAGPDERRDADDLGIDAETVRVDGSVLVAIDGELLRGGDHVVPRPAILREGDTRVLGTGRRCSTRPGSRRSAAGTPAPRPSGRASTPCRRSRPRRTPRSPGDTERQARAPRARRTDRRSGSSSGRGRAAVLPRSTWTTAGSDRHARRTGSAAPRPRPAPRCTRRRRHGTPRSLPHRPKPSP